MSKYSFPQIQDFVYKHSDAKFFDEDLVLYLKYLPKSPIIPSLKDPFIPRKKELDERMIFDLLSNSNVCIDQIWEARGYVADGKKLILVKDYLNNLAIKHHDKLLEWAKLSLKETTEETKTAIYKIREKLPKMLIDHVFKTKMITALQKEVLNKPEPVNEPEKTETSITVAVKKIDAASIELQAEAERQLLASDLYKMPYNEMRRLVFALKQDAELPDQKLTTIQSKLIAYKAVLDTKKKEDPGLNSLT